MLAQVSPAAYLPKLVGALLGLSSEFRFRDRPEVQLALSEEALAAARTVDPSEPARVELMRRALSDCQWLLYRLGRRAEGLALCAELLEIGRAEAERTGNARVRGLTEWADAVAEEGRYDEAADALTEGVGAILPDGPQYGQLAWSLVRWAGALDAAGRVGEMLAAYDRLVGVRAVDAAAGHAPMADHFQSLIGYARMLDAQERGEQAVAVRQKALGVLTELAAEGEHRNRSGSRAAEFWATLWSCSAAEGGRATPAAPLPPAGAEARTWTADARRNYAEGIDASRGEVDALVPRAAEEPDRHLAELVRIQRILTVRAGVWAGHDWRELSEEVRSLFDEGVDLARRLHLHRPADGTRILAGRLVDRASCRVVTKQYGPALDDFREALSLLGERG
ncbi:hypothetical protein ABZ990_09245 [Streptomyces sp. NPDC046203]|uniref:hypothetical protein n=1 Tax=Streptomyces sp. NPDC046203 TaxID=3154602 RepID=UPI00340F4D9E